MTFPSLLGTTRRFFHFTPPRLAKLRRIGTARNKEEKGEEATNISHAAEAAMFPSDLLYRRPWQLSSLKKSRANAAATAPLQISLGFAPQTFSFTDCGGLSPSLLPLLPLPPGSPGPSQAASPGLCSCVSLRYQSGLPQLMLTTVHSLPRG